MRTLSWIDQIERDGYAFLRGLYVEPQLETLRRAVTQSIAENKRAGSRRLLTVPEVAEIAYNPPLIYRVSEVLGKPAFPVRTILFDKTPSANWNLSFHHDRLIAVKERIEVEGFYGWSEKEGVPHVLPPTAVLARMVSARIHLDDCGEDNGPLRVCPGAHTNGILTKQKIEALVAERGEVVCSCKSGDVLLMRPLLLHASSKATNPGHRRVVHIEYAADPLPGGLEWYERAARVD